MPVNADKHHLWKPDIARSVDFYNNWFLQFAPQAYRETRLTTTQQVESALILTANLTNITPAILRQHPEILPILRMATAPPIARDRLIGLAEVSPNLVKNMEEKQRTPPRLDSATLEAGLDKISQIIARMQPGTFAFRLNIPILLQGGTKQINIPIDLVVMPVQTRPGELPLLIEAKSAGDSTNPNKRRKEEAAEGIDWVWEHRIDDLALFGV